MVLNNMNKKLFVVNNKPVNFYLHKFPPNEHQALAEGITLKGGKVLDRVTDVGINIAFKNLIPSHCCGAWYDVQFISTAENEDQMPDRGCYLKRKRIYEPSQLKIKFWAEQEMNLENSTKQKENNCLKSLEISKNPSKRPTEKSPGQATIHNYFISTKVADQRKSCESHRQVMAELPTLKDSRKIAQATTEKSNNEEISVSSTAPGEASDQKIGDATSAATETNDSIEEPRTDNNKDKGKSPNINKKQTLGLTKETKSDGPEATSKTRRRSLSPFCITLDLNDDVEPDRKRAKLCPEIVSDSGNFEDNCEGNGSLPGQNEYENSRKPLTKNGRRQAFLLSGFESTEHQNMRENIEKNGGKIKSVASKKTINILKKNTVPENFTQMSFVSSKYIEACIDAQEILPQADYSISNSRLKCWSKKLENVEKPKSRKKMNKETSLDQEDEDEEKIKNIHKKQTPGLRQETKEDTSTTRKHLLDTSLRELYFDEDIEPAEKRAKLTSIITPYTEMLTRKPSNSKKLTTNLPSVNDGKILLLSQLSEDLQDDVILVNESVEEVIEIQKSSRIISDSDEDDLEVNIPLPAEETQKHMSDDDKSAGFLQKSSPQVEIQGQLFRRNEKRQAFILCGYGENKKQELRQLIRENGGKIATTINEKTINVLSRRTIPENYEPYSWVFTNYIKACIKAQEFLSQESFTIPHQRIHSWSNRLENDDEPIIIMSSTKLNDTKDEGNEENDIINDKKIANLPQIDKNEQMLKRRDTRGILQEVENNEVAGIIQKSKKSKPKNSLTRDGMKKVETNNEKTRECSKVKKKSKLKAIKRKYSKEEKTNFIKLMRKYLKQGNKISQVFLLVSKEEYFSNGESVRSPKGLRLLWYNQLKKEIEDFIANGKNENQSLYGYSYSSLTRFVQYYRT